MEKTVKYVKDNGEEIVITNSRTPRNTQLIGPQ